MPGCPGIRNLGLTCYLNSALQAMAPCDAFVKWLDSNKGQSQSHRLLLEVLKGKSISKGSWNINSNISQFKILKVENYSNPFNIFEQILMMRRKKNWTPDHSSTQSKVNHFQWKTSNRQDSFFSCQKTKILTEGLHVFIDHVFHRIATRCFNTFLNRWVKG